MKITKFLTFAMALGVLFTSCNKDEVNGIEVPPVGEAGTGLMAVYLTDASGSLGTRAVEQGPDEEGTYDESKITTLEVFVYQGGVQKGYHAAKKDASGNELERVHYFEVPAGSVEVLALTNRADFDTNSYENVAYDVVKAELYATNGTVGAAIANPLVVPTTGIPMAGEKSATVVAAQTNTVVVEVSRLYARFNAPDASGASVALVDTAMTQLAEYLGVEESEIGNIDFSLQRYYVVNGINQSYLFPNYGTAEDGGRWSDYSWDLGNNYNNYIATEYQNKQMVRAYSGANYLTNEVVYLYENCPVYTNGRGFEAVSVYGFVIEGKLSVEVAGQASPVEVVRYWRINVSKTDDIDSLYKILRNAIYNVEIKVVKSFGSETPEEGENPEPPIPGVDAQIQVVVKVADWRFFNEKVDI